MDAKHLFGETLEYQHIHTEEHGWDPAHGITRQLHNPPDIETTIPRRAVMPGISS